MTVTGKINILLVAVMLFMGSVTTGLLAQREYQIALEQQLERARGGVLSRPNLQLYIYRRDATDLEPVLGGFLSSPAVTFAIARDSVGEVIARRDRAGVAAESLPPFEEMRTNASATQPGLIALTHAGQTVSTGFWTSLFGEQSIIHLTVPVISSLDPTKQDLTALDFYRAMARPGEQASLVVIGYIHLGINRKEILTSIRPSVDNMLLWSALLVLVCAVVVVLMTRQIAKSMAQLKRLAEDVAAGGLETRVEIRGGKEFRDIANALQGVIGSASNYKKEIEVDHKLLAMRADEGASELSRHRQELDEAAQEITATKSQMQKLAYYDNLTSLPNRRLFTEQLAMLLRLSKRGEKTLALLFLNLDNFKTHQRVPGSQCGRPPAEGNGQTPGTVPSRERHTCPPRGI